VNAATQEFLGQKPEPALYLVEPGRTGRREMHVEPGMLSQPFPDGWGQVNTGADAQASAATRPPTPPSGNSRTECSETPEYSVIGQVGASRFAGLALAHGFAQLTALAHNP
jgi:hypothetical protein